jgi:hypothetical protein
LEARFQAKRAWFQAWDGMKLAYVFPSRKKRRHN